MLGDVASVAVAYDGSLWALHRGGRVWDMSSFDSTNHITDEEPIAVDVIVQMDPDTGKDSWCICCGWVMWLIRHRTARMCFRQMSFSRAVCIIKKVLI